MRKPAKFRPVLYRRPFWDDNGTGPLKDFRTERPALERALVDWAVTYDPGTRTIRATDRVGDEQDREVTLEPWQQGMLEDLFQDRNQPGWVRRAGNYLFTERKVHQVA